MDTKKAVTKKPTVLYYACVDDDYIGEPYKTKEEAIKAAETLIAAGDNAGWPVLILRLVALVKPSAGSTLIEVS